MNKKKILTYTIATTFVFSILMPWQTNAQFIAELPNFGGPLVWILPCTCSSGRILYIYDYKQNTALPLHFIDGFSRLNREYNTFTLFTQQLGNYYPVGGSCLVTVSGVDGCNTIPTVGIISSLPFAGLGTGFVPSF